MLGHLGWVQFSNGVSANTHKWLALEILMTMAPILDEGVPSLSFQLERIQQVVPYEHIRELLGFQKGALEKVDEAEGMLDGFWNLISGEAHQQRNSIWNPIIQVFLSWMCKRILGRMRETKVTDMELNWLYSALIARQPIDLLTPKFGAGESLICGPNLVKKSRLAEEDFFRRFGRGACGRQFASIRQRDCLR
jgi:hypothetical protein